MLPETIEIMKKHVYAVNDELIAVVEESTGQPATIESILDYIKPHVLEIFSTPDTLNLTDQFGNDLTKW
jgi:hypothetical protein